MPDKGVPSLQVVDFQALVHRENPRSALLLSLSSWSGGDAVPFPITDLCWAIRMQVSHLEVPGALGACHWGGKPSAESGEAAPLFQDLHSPAPPPHTMQLKSFLFPRNTSSHCLLLIRKKPVLFLGSIQQARP